MFVDSYLKKLDATYTLRAADKEAARRFLESGPNREQLADDVRDHMKCAGCGLCRTLRLLDKIEAKTVSKGGKNSADPTFTACLALSHWPARKELLQETARGNCNTGVGRKPSGKSQVAVLIHWRSPRPLRSTATSFTTKSV